MSRLHASSAAFLIAALLLTAVVAALGGLSVARKVATFQPLGFTAEATGALQTVAAVSDPGTGLRPGDQVLFVQGREATRPGALEETLRTRETSELLVARDGEMVAVTYQRPPLDLDLPFLVLALVGAAYLLIGFYTLLKDRRGQGRLFFLWCLASAALFLLTPDARYDAAGRVLFTGDLLGRLLLPPLTLHLFLLFPRPLDELRGRRRWLPFVYLPAAILLAVQAQLALSVGGGGSVASAALPLALLDRLELFHLLAFALAAVAVLVLRLARTRDWEQHRQLRWMAVGLAGGYLPFAALYAVPWAAGFDWPELVTTAAVVPLGLVPLTFAYAILRYKLWDIEVMVRDTVSYTLTLLVGLIGFSLANLAITRGLPTDLPLLRNVLVFAAGITIAGVLVPAKRSISTGLERIQYRGSFRKRRSLATFGRRLLHERDLDRLCSQLLEAVEEAVDLETANLYVVRDGALVPMRPDPSLPDRLPVDVLGDDLWEAEIRRLSGTGLPDPESLPARKLFAAGYRYALPLTVHDNPVGLAVTGWKLGQERLTSDDVALLRQLLDQAALAIENAQLVDQLQSRLDEVSRLQQYSEGIIESSPAGIAVLGSGLRILSANTGFSRLVGRAASRLTGRHLEEVLPVRPLPEPGAGPLEVSYCDADRRERHLQLSTAHFEHGDGRILVVHDVTERVAMESALKEQDRLAALGVMAAGVAHEVNTPLTGISSYAQMLLADTPDDDPRRRLLEKVERQTFRASKIVNGLLDFARNRQGEMGPVRLGEVAEECLELMRERLAKRGVEVRWHAPSPGTAEPVVVHGDAGELQQVVTNLLLNACEAMEEDGGGTLDLRLEAVGDRGRLTVADSGHGISEEDLDRIFEPFWTSKLGRGGTGLGLAISSDIVRHHRGDLRVESTPGEGATFTLELPLEPDAPEETAGDGALDS